MDARRVLLITRYNTEQYTDFDTGVASIEVKLEVNGQIVKHAKVPLWLLLGLEEYLIQLNERKGG